MNNKKVLLIAAPAGLLLVGAIAFFALRSSKADPVCAENVARLEALANADISQTEALLKELNGSAPLSGQSGNADSIEAGIMDGSGVLDDVKIKQVFQGKVILGDSITESIWEYGYLDKDVVISKRGLSVAGADEQIAMAINANPSVIFMAFGSNDLESYIDDSAAFIDAYRTQVKKLQEALPEIPIYINGILPIQQSAIDAIPALGYYGDYNLALQDFCKEMGCTYLDTSFLVEGDDSVYEPDGEHVVMGYYPKWLSFMAEMAGIV